MKSTFAIMGVAVVLSSTFVLPSTAQEIMKHEPQMGTMVPGMVAYVDNGKCPKGQVMEVTAGTLGNRNGHPQPRGRRCIPRP